MYFYRILETDAYNINRSSIAYINIEEDILPLIRRNQFYDIATGQSGKQHNIRYNLQSLEHQVKIYAVNNILNYIFVLSRCAKTLFYTKAR